MEKGRCLGAQIKVESYSNKINGKPVCFRERPTKRERELMDYMNELGLVTSTNNCVPQVMVKTANGPRKRNVVKNKTLMNC